MSKSPSNAFEVPLFGIHQDQFIDMHQCDACTIFAPKDNMTTYAWPYKTLPALVLPTRLRQFDLQLCRGCEVAYGATVRANKYVLKSLQD